MNSVNKVFVMGNLTAAPELRNTPSGTGVTDLRLAINRSWSTDSGEKKEETTFLDVTVWGRQAESVCEYLDKGSPVFVEGRLNLESWQDKKTGENRQRLKVIAERVQFLPGSKPANRQESSHREPAYAAA